MTYVRVALAAIQRYRFETPYREMYLETTGKKRVSAPFGIILKRLVADGMVPQQSKRPLEKEFARLSRLVHTGRVEG